MNRLIGFFKQKISEVKEENKQELQALAQVLTENEYSTEKVLAMLQSMKANYMNWNILIANEASTGLYYSQLHNRNICLKKIKNNKEGKKQLEKNRLKLKQISEISKELREINELNGKWMNNVNNQLEGINEYLNYIRDKNQMQKMDNFNQEDEEEDNEFLAKLLQSKDQDKREERKIQQDQQIRQQMKPVNGKLTNPSQINVQEIDC